jgi:hypothetical protein
MSLILRGYVGSSLIRGVVRTGWKLRLGSCELGVAVEVQQIADVVHRLAVEPPQKVIAELMFGFWRQLTIAARERTLVAAVPAAWFRHRRQRALNRRPMARLHGLRNRMAHHEPLLRQNLSARRSDVLTLLDRVAPPFRSDVDSQSRWAAIVQGP